MNRCTMYNMICTFTASAVVRSPAHSLSPIVKFSRILYTRTYTQPYNAHCMMHCTVYDVVYQILLRLADKIYCSAYNTMHNTATTCFKSCDLSSPLSLSVVTLLLTMYHSNEQQGLQASLGWSTYSTVHSSTSFSDESQL